MDYLAMARVKSCRESAQRARRCEGKMDGSTFGLKSKSKQRERGIKTQCLQRRFSPAPSRS